MVVDGTEQDVLGRYGPDSLSINQTNNQQCHRRWTEAAIGCCRTWSPPQNITIQTRVTEVTLWCAHRTWSVPLIAWELLIIDFWNLPPPPGTAFAVKVGAVSLSFVWIRASTYTEKKPTLMCAGSVVTFLPPLRCFHESLTSSTNPQSDGSGYKKTQVAFSFHGFPTLWPPSCCRFMPFR